jgi:sugar/nucleoside kinase (ribokinase family)
VGVGKLVVATVIGDDGHGHDLLQAMQSLPVDTTAIVRDPRRLTPTYTKPMKQDASGAWQELNRFDVRTRSPLSDHAHCELAGKLQSMFDRVDGLIVLDQLVDEGWGVVDSRLRSVLKALSQQNPQKLIYADSRAFLPQFEFGILKGNRSEFLRAAGLAADGASRDSLGSVLCNLAARHRRPMYCTIGEDGILVGRTSGEAVLVPGYPQPPPIDICGAGDAATSGIVASLLAGADELEAATVGNLVASITVQQLGVTGTATPRQVLDRLTSR